LTTDRYETWKEYFDEKFNGDEFIVDDKTGTKIGTYDISSTVSSCHITVIWPNEDWTQIEDVQFFSSQTKAWSGESLGPNPKDFGRLTQENLERLESFLEVPLVSGWTAVEYYVAGRLLKTVSFEGNGQDKRILADYTGETGCLMILLFWPILLVIETLVSKRIIGKKRTLYIEPMNKRKVTLKNNKGRLLE
jgi:hypothetical protein